MVECIIIEAFIFMVFVFERIVENFIKEPFGFIYTVLIITVRLIDDLMISHQLFNSL